MNLTFDERIKLKIRLQKKIKIIFNYLKSFTLEEMLVIYLRRKEKAAGKNRCGHVFGAWNEYTLSIFASIKKTI